MKRMLVAIILSLSIVPAHADVWCVDTSSPPYSDIVSTVPYQAPASTTTVKADLLKGYYRMMWERDKARQLWANQKDETIQAERERDLWKERRDELYRVLIGSMNYQMDQP